MKSKLAKLKLKTFTGEGNMSKEKESSVIYDSGQSKLKDGNQIRSMPFI